MSREKIEPRQLRCLAEHFAHQWGSDSPEFIRGFSNIVYRLHRANGPIYLRITPAAHRSQQQILSELSIIQHLSDSGAPASAPCPDREGRLIREGEAQGATYFACAFREAEGASYRDRDRHNDHSFFRNSGRALAALHDALDAFQPGPAFQRFAWSDDLWHAFAQIVPPSEIAAWELFQETIHWLATLPRTKPAFGLIHGDFNLSNLRILPGRVTAFDFDSSCEHWRAYDLACFLHYFGARPEAERMFAYDTFLSGYAEQRVLDASLIQQLPRFGKMRLLYSFLVFAREWGFENLSPEQQEYFQVRRRLFSDAPTWPGVRAA